MKLGDHNSQAKIYFWFDPLPDLTAFELWTCTHHAGRTPEHMEVLPPKMLRHFRCLYDPEDPAATVAAEWFSLRAPRKARIYEVSQCGGNDRNGVRMMVDYTEQPTKITCTLCGVPFWTRRPERDTCSPCLAGVDCMEAEVKALAFACNDTERTFKGRDVEISNLEDRVVDAAITNYQVRQRCGTDRKAFEAARDDILDTATTLDFWVGKLLALREK